MHFLESSENIFFKKNIHLQLIRQSSLGLRRTGQLGREPSSAGKLIHRREEVGVKRVQVTTGDEVTSSEEHEHSASVTCMSMTDGHATGDALLLRDPSAHPNRTSQTPHCDDGSPGASGNGTLCLPLSTII